LTIRTDRLLLASAIIGSFLGGLSLRIFLIALPTVARGLGTDVLGISWALIAYDLASISLSIVFGRLGDISGRYRIFGLGFVIMTLFAFLCGVAQDVGQLIAFRFLQGVGAAMSASAARVLAMEAMPEGSEGKANGLMTMAFHSGLFVGPPLGGLIIDYISWRWTFFFMVPIGLAGLTLTALRLKRGHPPVARERHPAIDYLGAALLIVMTVMLVLLLDRRSAAFAGVGRKGALALAFAGVLAFFLLHERRASAPVMNLALFRVRMFTFSIVSLFAVSITYSIMSLLMPFYLQEVLHLSPSFVGLIFLISPVFTIGLATASGRLSDRMGPRVPASIGVTMTIAAFVVGSALRADSPWVLPAVLMALLGLGSGFFNTPNQTAIIGSVPRGQRGFATGMVNAMFGLGHLLGVSLGGLLLAVMFQYYSGAPGASPTPDNPLAFVSSMNAVYLGCVGLALLAFALSFLRGGRKIGA
jgi:EmrB/QacA subfamily drug resistance transporter